MTDKKDLIIRTLTTGVASGMSVAIFTLSLFIDPAKLLAMDPLTRIVFIIMIAVYFSYTLYLINKTYKEYNKP